MTPWRAGEVCGIQTSWNQRNQKVSQLLLKWSALHYPPAWTFPKLATLQSCWLRLCSASSRQEGPWGLKRCSYCSSQADSMRPPWFHSVEGTGFLVCTKAYKLLAVVQILHFISSAYHLPSDDYSHPVSRCSTLHSVRWRESFLGWKPGAQEETPSCPAVFCVMLLSDGLQLVPFSEIQLCHNF